MENAIKNNNINNCPVTVDNVRIAHKIYRTNMRNTKGKMTRKQPKSVIKNEEVESILVIVMNEHQYVTLFSDIFFINRILFLITLLQHLELMRTENMPNRKAVSFQEKLQDVLTLHNNRDFVMRTIRMDI